MRIDADVEPVVREALAASVAGEPERFDRALLTVADGGDDFAARAVTLALAIGGAALFTVHQGHRPDTEQLTHLASGLVADASEWAADVAEPEALEYLTSLADRRSPNLEPGDVAELAFGAGGWLLSAFLSDDQEWTDFLDRILDALEAAPVQ